MQMIEWGSWRGELLKRLPPHWILCSTEHTAREKEGDRVQDQAQVEGRGTETEIEACLAVWRGGRLVCSLSIQCILPRGLEAPIWPQEKLGEFIYQPIFAHFHFRSGWMFIKNWGIRHHFINWKFTFQILILLLSLSLPFNLKRNWFRFSPTRKWFHFQMK